MEFHFRAERSDALWLALARSERWLRAAVRELPTGDAQRLWLEWRRRREVEAKHSAVATATLSGSPVVYLPALPWDYRFQRPQRLARSLAAAGHPVLYVEGFARLRLGPQRQLYDRGGGVTALRLKVPGRPDLYRGQIDLPAAAQVAAIIRQGLRRRPLAVVAQLPAWSPVARRLAAELGVPLVYDRIDLHADFPGVPAETAALERELIDAADLVVATSSALQVLDHDPDRLVLLLPNAVDATEHGTEQKSRSRPRDPERLQVLYFGALASWFDEEAVACAARSRPGWSFRLVGRVEDARIRSLGALPNVQLVGEVPHESVPAELARADVLIVPFRDSPLTRAVDPVKVYEAFAAGVPIAARRLPEISRWGEDLIGTYAEPGELAACIAKVVSAQSLELAQARRSIAERESWSARAATLLRAIDELAGAARPVPVERPRAIA